MAASSGFLALAWQAGAFKSAFGVALFAGLVLSWWGDLFLLFPGYFLWGLVAFFLAHVAYSAAFLLHGLHWGWVAAALMLLAVPLFLLYHWLMPHVGSLRIPVQAYMAIISLMTVLGCGTAGRRGTLLILTGALLFFASDIFVARGRFVQPGPLNGLIGLPLYYFGQLALAYSPRLMDR